MRSSLASLLAGVSALCLTAQAVAQSAVAPTAANDRIDQLATELPQQDRPDASQVPGTAARPLAMDVAFRTAGAAFQQGDYTHAAETYRRMLAADPNLDRVRLELGMAYARLGQYDKARTEFRTVLQKAIPDRVKRNIENVLRQIDERTKKNEVTGSVATGTLYDTNGNSAPSDGQVLVRDTLFNLDGKGRATHDAQEFATVTLGHTYHAQSLPLDWRSSGTYYQTWQDRLSQLDLRIASVTTGPVYRFADGLGSADLTAGYTDVELDGHSYLRLPALEAGYERDFGKAWHARLAFREEYRDFVNAPGVTVYDERTGLAHQLRLGLLYVLTPHDLVDGAFTLRREEAKQSYFADWQWSPEIGYTHSWGEGWFARGELSYRDSGYDAPDRVLTDRTRRDLESACGLTIGKNFAHNISLTGAYEYRHVDSSIPNYDYDDHRATLTAGWHF